MVKRGEIEHMRLAIREAKRSNFEDTRVHPYVGVVIVRKNEIMGSACRGDLAPGDHAEFTCLEKKLADEKLVGCTVYTTLEPCINRNHPKISCADRLIQRHIGRVVIGILDPDQRITGRGVLRLRRGGVAVDLFPPDLMSELEELNRDFIRDRESTQTISALVGISEAGITAFYPSRDYYSRLRVTGETIDRYISTAENTVIMVSINLMTGLPFHELCNCIKVKLENDTNFRVTISLLNSTAQDSFSTRADLTKV